VGASETHYYLTDGLGSTLALTDAAGDIVNTYDYDVFGALRAETGSQANDFTFAGEQVDASTGFQYLRARYYDMQVGRFVSRDPLSGIMGLPASQTRFAYVMNAPTNLLDPSGLCVFGAPSPKPIKKATDFVHHFLNNAENQYSWIRTGAFFVMGFSCPLAETGIGAFVCAGASVVYGSAVYGSTNVIRERVCSGEYSEQEGYARNLTGLLPIPFPFSVPVKELIKQFIIRNTDVGEALFHCPEASESVNAPLSPVTRPAIAGPFVELGNSGQTIPRKE
jgi:RHS repeat-associated protein